MRSSMYLPNEQAKIIQCINKNARNTDKLSLSENNNFVIGNQIRTFAPTDSAYFLVHYYINNEVKENYLQIKKDGQMAIVDSPDDEATEADPTVSFSFSKGQLAMSPVIACHFIPKF